ncbi:MAG TPA: 2'-deoxycytidine 5'-triphosphate deaminase [Acidimicrobiales bacterium]
MAVRKTDLVPIVRTMTGMPEPLGPGIWPAQWLSKAVASGIIHAPDFDETLIQPASLDLRLGAVAYRLRCSFLPGKNDSVKDQIKNFAVGPPLPLDQGTILERNRPYLIPLQESLNLPQRVRARANPKSSTGRLDVFTRVITDRSSKFDDIRPGYSGQLYLEVVPRSFAIMVRTGLSLNQLRLMKGDVAVADSALRLTHRQSPLLYRNGVALDRRDVRAHGGLWLSLDLVRREGEVAGYRAKHNSSLIDMSLENRYDPADYWDSIIPEQGNRVVLEPEDFYLFLSSEAVQIPPQYAAEMSAFDASGGEVRTHYAGFFDPGFGHDPAGFFSRGSRAALEIRAHDVPFAVDNLQRVCKLRFEIMVEEPNVPYGAEDRSHYQGQLSTLSKHFRVNRGAGQLTFSRAGTVGTTRVRRIQSHPGVPEQDVAENRLEAL